MSESLIKQGTPEWKQLKCGKISASEVHNILQEKQGTGYRNYRAQLICERLTGCTTETYKNTYMDRGNEDEPNARLCYEYETGYTVEQVAFVVHPVLEFAGCSPDGTIGADGLCEIKRKIPAIHIDYIIKNRVPPEYAKQMMFQLACTGREWNDFVSYCPELPEEMQLFICRLERDDSMIALMEIAVRSFNESVEQMISDLKKIQP